jgi:hypothetical protein
MIPLSPVMPQNRYHADSSDPAKIRIISILRRPPTRRVQRSTHMMQKELPQVVTSQQVHDGTHNKHVLQQ